MAYSNIEWVKMSNSAIVKQLGKYIRHIRLKQNTTQAHLAEAAGLNRWTISQIEKGESVTLTTLIQVLRALDALHVFEHFEVKDEISPLEYAKLKEKQPQRYRAKRKKPGTKEDLGW